MQKTPLAAHSRRIGFYTALASLALTVPSLAQSVWTGASDNEFRNGANWNPALPGTGDAAVVDDGSPQVTNSSTIRQLGVDGGNVTITNTGVLTVTSGSTIASGSISINAGGALNSDVDLNGGGLSIDGDLNGKLTLNNGNVSVNGTLDSATIGSATSLSNNGQVGDVNVSAAGTFVNNSGATAGAITNAGTGSNAGTLDALTNTAGNFTNNAGGTITGKTTVSGGTVTNNFVVTEADVEAAATFVNNNGATAGKVTNSGTVSNAGTIASVDNKDGSFTNNFGGEVTGETTVSGGNVTNNATLATVAVGAGGSFTNTSGASAGAVANSGISSNAGTIASLTNTSGTFTNNSGGTIAGKATVAGGTVTNNFVVTQADVAAAAAFVNNSGATVGALENAGNTSNAGTVASLNNTAGTFTNNGGGTVTGTSAVSGGSVVNNAVLADVDVGSGGTFTNNSGSTAGVVKNAGAGSNDGTIASLAVSDGLFSNTGTINGTATVTGGALVNDGVVVGSVDVFDGGLLSGTGVIGGLAVNAGGVFSPGPGIQTATLDGDVTFRSRSTYRVEVDTTGLSDRLDASGAISIEGGTLEILAASGTYAPTTDYTILTGGSVTGAFDDVISNFAFLLPSLSYGTTSVDLTLDRNDVRFADMAETANGRATANAVEALGPSNSLFLNVVSLDEQSAGSAFSQLSGEAHASLKSELLWDSRFPRQAVLDRKSPAQGQGLRQSDDVVFWTSAYAAANQLAGDGNAAGVDGRTAGVLFGADAAISDTWRLGGLLGYSHLAMQPEARADSYHAGFYVSGEIGLLDLMAGAIYSHNEISTRRGVAFGSLAESLTADYDSATRQAFADLSWTFAAEHIKFQPFANIAYVDLDTDAFSETGGTAAVSAAEGSDAVTVSTVGLRWSADIPGSELPIAATGMLGWRHAAGDLTPSARLAFAGSSFFTIGGVTMPGDALVMEAGISARLSATAQVTLTYLGEFAGGVQSNAARANLIVNF